MNKRILYFRKNDGCDESVIQQFAAIGYNVMECSQKCNCISDLLCKDFFYFVFSFRLDETVYNACMGTATKYVVCFDEKQSALYEEMLEKRLTNCYFVFQSEVNAKSIERFVFNERELAIYEVIDELHMRHKNSRESEIGLKQLKDIKEDKEIIRLTNIFFDKMESEKGLLFGLKEQLLEYIDLLLKDKSIASWMEVLLWNRRHECVDLEGYFWEFCLLKKVVAVFVDEMQEYYKSGIGPSVTELGSVEEMIKTYFQLLLLLRRLEYDVASEEDMDIVKYIVQKKVSGTFVHHVIAHNKIYDEEKVYFRLEELLQNYER